MFKENNVFLLPKELEISLIQKDLQDKIADEIKIYFTSIKTGKSENFYEKIKPVEDIIKVYVNTNKQIHNLTEQELNALFSDIMKLKFCRSNVFVNLLQKKETLSVKLLSNISQSEFINTFDAIYKKMEENKKTSVACLIAKEQKEKVATR